MDQQVTVSADLSAFRADLAELRLRLEALDPAERLFGEISGVLAQCLAVGGDELVTLESSPAPGAGELLIKAQLGVPLQRGLAALRAMQGDFVGHGDSSDGVGHGIQ